LPPDPGENARSIAMIVTPGNLRIADLGDLFWDKEYDLACPVNKLGQVDLYMTTHHGAASAAGDLSPTRRRKTTVVTPSKFWPIPMARSPCAMTAMAS
jgi:hypothetical protein